MRADSLSSRTFLFPSSLPENGIPVELRTIIISVATSSVVLSLILTGVGMAIKTWLAKTFIPREELKPIQDRVDAFATVIMQVRELSDGNRDDIRTLQIEQRNQWERISVQLIVPLGKITDRLEAVSLAQERQAATLEHIAKHVENLTRT